MQTGAWNDVAELNRRDARRDSSYNEKDATTLPLGGSTLVRSFDELALLLPGVAPPPPTIGNGAGPGQGAGVGSAGQFAVNGLRSRANNFTVDGSDNNDEDIGVRRQGFLTLIPQPVESIKEYQVITLLAPAQFGRNIGAQVNAVSRSGGRETHGTVYGMLSSSRLNARNYFDTLNGTDTFPLLAGNSQPVELDEDQIFVQNRSGGKDSSTFSQQGFTIGGPLGHRPLFYFVSAEQQITNARKEVSFAVPTVEERGAFGTGATGIFKNPFTQEPTFSYPVVFAGNAILDLFPFPNNPAGVSSSIVLKN